MARKKHPAVPNEKTNHEKLIDRAKASIDEVFSDTSVSRGTTRDSLETIMNHVDDYLIDLRNAGLGQGLGDMAESE